MVSMGRKPAACEMASANRRGASKAAMDLRWGREGSLPLGLAEDDVHGWFLHDSKPPSAPSSILLTPSSVLALESFSYNASMA